MVITLPAKELADIIRHRRNKRKRAGIVYKVSHKSRLFITQLIIKHGDFRFPVNSNAIAGYSAALKNAGPLQADQTFIKNCFVTRNSLYNNFPVFTASWRLRILNFGVYIRCDSCFTHGER